MNYFSKILWLGEHSVIKGSQALAAPYRPFHGHWSNSVEHLEKQQYHLRAFSAYLQQLDQEGTLKAPIDWHAFQQELDQGLVFASNIPVGYGLGSSGALCAAVYDRFCRDPIQRDNLETLGKLKAQFAQLENFFHSSSSGTDPLICYLDQPVLLLPEGTIRITKLPDINGKETVHFFLLDTRISRQTGPMVTYFLERCEQDPQFANGLSQHLIPDTNRAIEAFLQSDWEKLGFFWEKISRFQRQELERMIPDAFRSYWDVGINTGTFLLKLCGAGGGGFLLGFTPNRIRTQAYFEGQGLGPLLKFIT